jgi:predicted Zn-dependent protease with MMP-like domain
MRRAERERFDELLEAALGALPPKLHALLDEAPLIVDDRPTPEMMEELGVDEHTESLCGLHSGVPLTERSVAAGHEPPETIHLFREGIVEQAGGWDEWQDEDGAWWGGEAKIAEEIRITLLHEIGHHFGLSEEDLDELGYA